jgi:hypothetical protein
MAGHNYNVSGVKTGATSQDTIVWYCARCVFSYFRNRCFFVFHNRWHMTKIEFFARSAFFPGYPAKKKDGCFVVFSDFLFGDN